MGGLRRCSDLWELLKDGVEADSGDTNDAFECILFASERKWKGGKAEGERERRESRTSITPANPLLSVNIAEG